MDIKAIANKAKKMQNPEKFLTETCEELIQDCVENIKSGRENYSNPKTKNLFNELKETCSGMGVNFPKFDFDRNLELELFS